MKCNTVKFKIENDEIIRVDTKYKFFSRFNCKTGFYLRSDVIIDGKVTQEEPFMASYPHLIDVGIMGHCIHGSKGLCVKAGIQCYQSGLNIKRNNMSVSNFEKIVSESHGLIDQIALGGRGDPDCHENFEDILKLCKKYNIVPNYTTSGFLMNDEKAKLTKEYCGAVAVSWYRSEYTNKAIDILLDNEVKTNIHFVVDNETITEAIHILETNSLPKGINAIVFLLFKPVGQGQQDKILDVNSENVKKFFSLVHLPRDFKVGFDSCFVPGVLNFSKNIDLNSLDTCEGGRYSMYISSDMMAMPCSFDQTNKFNYDISNNDIFDAWNSEEFEGFRRSLRNRCSDCSKRIHCMGGCPLEKEVVLCNLKEKNL